MSFCFLVLVAAGCHSPKGKEITTRPISGPRVTIEGYVKNPGSYAWHEGITASELIREADGPTRRNYRVSIGKQSYSLGHSVAYEPLNPGDKVYVDRGIEMFHIPEIIERKPIKTEYR